MRGKADRMRLRIWMHDGGTLLHSSKWYSHRNSGKSCSSTSSTLSVPCAHQSASSATGHVSSVEELDTAQISSHVLVVRTVTCCSSWAAT